MPRFPALHFSWSLLKLMSIESVMPSNLLILCHLLLLLPSIFPSNSVFSNESALCIRWPNYWSFKPANSKGNQPWIFIGRGDAEAEAPWKMLSSKYDIDNRDAILMYHSWGSLPAALEDWKELCSQSVFMRLGEIHTSGPRQAPKVSEADSAPIAFIVSSHYH